MKRSRFGRCAMCLWIVASLAGCGIPAQQIEPQTGASESAAVSGRFGDYSVTQGAKNQALLYVADDSNGSGGPGQVLIFTYPQGVFVGKLTGFQNLIYGLCVDKTGDLFATDFWGQDVQVYARGATKPMRTLHTHGSPFGCAVDPTSGDLAVLNWCEGPLGSCSSNGTILIYKNGRDRPKKYIDPNIGAPFYATYDQAGDLFVNGLLGPFYSDAYGELPEGSSSFKSLTLNKLPTAQQPGGILWDNGELVVAPILSGNVIYRYTIHGNRGKRIGVIKLGVPPNNGPLAFWIQGQTLIAPQYRLPAKHGIGQVQFFTYPSGAGPTFTLNHTFYYPTAAVVSPAAN